MKLMQSRQCSVSGCESKHYGLGFCNRHYRRFKAHGDTTINNRQKRAPIEKRFWSKVHKTKSCWIWKGCFDTKGYGKINSGGNGKTLFAHRLSYEIHFGVHPGDLHVLHRCDNPACVNPDHLFLGTHADNMRDMWRKNRGRCDGAGRNGCSNGNSKLTDSDVVEIRKKCKAGGSFRSLAREYGVSKTLISYIAKRKIWTHLEDKAA